MVCPGKRSGEVRGASPPVALPRRPTFTFSDVERALQVEVRRRGLLSKLKLIVDPSSRTEEILLLEKLERKYRLPLEHHAAVIPDASQVVDDRRVAAECSIPVQASPF